MRQMRLATILFLCLMLCGCGLLDPEQQMSALAAVDAMLQMGHVTPEQAEGLRQAILAKGQGSWWEQVGQLLLAAGLGYLGVQVAPGRAASVAVKRVAAGAAAAGAQARNEQAQP